METLVPKPSSDRVEYDHPEKYLTLNASLGDQRLIQEAAQPLLQEEPEQTFVAIWQWVQQNLKYDARCAYAWRNFDTALETRAYGGCADHAVVFAALARACGIPTGFVKTMDADWIRDFRLDRPRSSWNGHVFLEIFVAGSWRLLDASAMKTYDEYEPGTRIFPGDRYAYDKGDDPFLLVLSLDWERWKQQASAYFSEFDLAQLPVAGGRDLMSRQP